MYYSRRLTCGTCIISLHTPFIFILLFSTVTYSVEIYGPETKAKNIFSVSIRIKGEDDARTKNKLLTDRTTEVRGYEMYLLYGFPRGLEKCTKSGLRCDWLPCGKDGAIMPHSGMPTRCVPYNKFIIGHAFSVKIAGYWPRCRF